MALREERNTDFLTRSSHVRESTEYIEIVQQCTQIKQEYFELKSKYDSLLVEHEVLRVRGGSQMSSEALNNAEKEKSALQATVRTYEMRIYGLEAQLSQCEKEVSDLKKKDQSSNAMTRELFAFQTKMDEFERQLELKSNEVNRV
jgi:DNA repair ATPase RecN